MCGVVAGGQQKLDVLVEAAGVLLLCMHVCDDVQDGEQMRTAVESLSVSVGLAYTRIRTLPGTPTLCKLTQRSPNSGRANT